jgi:hypothetical protein
MARTINANYANVYCAVHTFSKWPTDLKHADAIIVLLNHGGSAVNPAVKEATERGAGFMAVHWGVEVNKGVEAEYYLKWLGGYFETFYSVNPVWTANFTEIPKHEITRGVKPFSINDEWYYHMRFVEKMQGVTPILYDLPPLKTIADEGKKRRSAAATPRSTRMCQPAKSRSWPGPTTAPAAPAASASAACISTATSRTTISAPCCSTPSPGRRSWKSRPTECQAKS